MISLLYFGAILLGLVINNGSGQPSITSTVQSLSGELCPGKVTFSCDSLDTDSSIIDFLLDDSTLVRYEFSVGITTPVPQGFVAQIPSAEFDSVNIKYSYENFTLLADLDDLIFYLGQNISCGSVAIRSNSIQVGNYTIRDLPQFSSELLNVRYSAVYTGLELKLHEIIVVWDNLKQKNDCYQNIHYHVQLTSLDSKSNMMSNVSNDCDNMTCSTIFFRDGEEMGHDVYIISITTSSNVLNISTSTTASFNTSVSNGFAIYNDPDCKKRIMCSSANRETCLVQYQDGESLRERTIKANSEWVLNFLPKQFINFEISKQLSTNQELVGRFNYTHGNSKRNYGAFVGVGVIFLIVGIMELVGCALFGLVCSVIAWNRLGRMVCLWVILFGVSWLLALISISLWISFGVLASSRSCIEGSEGDIAISATVLSLLLVIVSVLVTSLFILNCKCKGKRSKQEKQHPIKGEYIFNIGIKIKPIAKNTNCVNLDCGKSLKWKKEKLCLSCAHYICKCCPEHFAYIARLQKEEGRVCNQCHEKYLEENKKIAEASSVCYIIQNMSESQAQIEISKCSCPRTTECRSCKQNVCKEHNIMELDISNGKEKVCKFCYMLHKRRFEEQKRQLGNNYIYDFSAETGEVATSTTNSSTNGDIIISEYQKSTSNPSRMTDSKAINNLDANSIRVSSTMVLGDTSTGTKQSKTKEKNKGEDGQKNEQSAAALHGEPV